MKTIPIIFSPPMAKQIAAGNKTQTRSTTNLELINKNPDKYMCFDKVHNSEWVATKRNDILGDEAQTIKCPYGQKGDELVVKERFRIVSWDSDERTATIEYSDHSTTKKPVPEGEKYDLFMQRIHRRYCDLNGVKFYDPNNVQITKSEYLNNMDDYFYTLNLQEAIVPWKPPIHMPLWAARSKMKIKNISVERLCSITREDAIAEGIEASNGNGWIDYLNPTETMPQAKTFKNVATEIASFSSLWTIINGHQSWDKNPWVWRIEFEKGGQQ